MKRSSKLLLAAAGAGFLVWMARRRRAKRYSFQNRVVAIAGGSRGLGLAMARRLVDEGAHLALLGRSEDSLQAAKADLESRGGAAVRTIPCDVTRKDEVEAAFTRIEEVFGRLDLLINNAGFIPCAPFENHEVEDFRKAIDTHLLGPVYASWNALPLMKRHGGGRILNVSSIGGKVGVPHLTAYSASKYALVGFSRSLAAEARNDGIRVTVACPGLMRTGSQSAASFRGRQGEEYDWFAGMGATPGLSISAETAARRILEACRLGEVERVFPPHWWVAARGDALAPWLSVAANSVVNRGLPDPVGGPTERQSGREAGEGREPASQARAGAELNQR